MSTPVVTVKYGKLRGITDTNLDGQEYYKYLGIPYAKPPEGNLRFKAPQPPEPWNDVKDCTNEGSPCYMLDIITQQLTGSEDCLYLNVFTKELPKGGASLKPVMVFIHGGGFTMGSGSPKMQGAKYLMTEDIVLVTINYRLGILGFLSLEDTSLEVPGNAGLKDQIFALKWVQENIANFGGDPKNVTIFGVSAGGASVQYQVISPSAKGLFHKAIMQSGSVLNPWAWGDRNAIQVAKILGENVSSEKEALEILMNVDVKDLFQAQLKMPDNLMESNIKRPFGPVIEKPNPSAFLTENPLELLASGHFNQVPIIQGVTSSEGMICGISKLMPHIPFVVAPEMGILWSLGLEKGSDPYKKVEGLLKEYYFKDGITNEGKYNFFSDTMFVLGAIESTKLIAKTSSSPVYFYVFSANAEFTKGMRQFFFGIADTDLVSKDGVPHGADQIYLFDSEMIPKIGMPPASEAFVRLMVKLWTNFAKTGKPSDNNIQWEPVTDGKDLTYLDISENPSLKANPFADRMEFWRNIIYKELPVNKRIFNV